MHLLQSADLEKKLTSKKLNMAQRALVFEETKLSSVLVTLLSSSIQPSPCMYMHGRKWIWKNVFAWDCPLDPVMTNLCMHMQTDQANLTGGSGLV